MGVISTSKSYGYFSVTNGSRPTGSTLCIFTIPHFRGFVNHLPPVPRTILQKAAGGDCHRQSFQKPKWSSIPRQCAHWHGMGWSWGCFRRKRRNPASLYQVRAGRILKEGGLVCGSKPFSASLSRILSPFLGGTRKGPPEGHPAEILNRASDRIPPALTGHLPLCIKSLSAASGRGKIFQKTQKRS